MKVHSLQLVLPAAILAVVFSAPGRAAEDAALSKPEVQAKVQYCKDCHGQSGRGFPGSYPVPRIAGQTVVYLENKFGVITEHRRDNPTAKQFMEPALGSVDAATRKAVAVYFNGLDPAPVGGAPKELMPAGKKIYTQGIPESNIPACATCHGPDAKGSDINPRLAGQLNRYTIKVMTNWSIINREHSKDASGKDSTAVKAPVEHNLTQTQIAAVAAYLSDLK